MSSVSNKLGSLEVYLDDQTWGRNTSWPLGRFWRNYGPRVLYLEAKYFIQRGRRGYSDRDLWNANSHIARTVLAFLDARSIFGGVPVAAINKGESHEKSAERRRKAQEDIRWLMEQYLEDDLENEYWMSRWG